MLDDFARYIIAWKLRTTMKAEDVTATLDLALKASGLDRATVVRRTSIPTSQLETTISTRAWLH